MHFVLKVNDTYVMINNKAKYSPAVKLVTSLDLATVFGSVDEAARCYTKYLDDFRNVIDDTADVVIKIQEVTINVTDRNIIMPNLLEI